MKKILTLVSVLAFLFVGVLGGSQSVNAQAQNPVLYFNADRNLVPFGASVNLYWNAVNAKYCVARGAWSGAKNLSGIFSTGPMTRNKTYHLTCLGEGGTYVSKSVTISVKAKPVPKTVNHFKSE